MTPTDTEPRYLLLEALTTYAAADPGEDLALHFRDVMVDLCHLWRTRLGWEPAEVVRWFMEAVRVADDEVAAYLLKGRPVYLTSPTGATPTPDPPWL